MIGLAGESAGGQRVKAFATETMKKRSIRISSGRFSSQASRENTSLSLDPSVHSDQLFVGLAVLIAIQLLEKQLVGVK